MASFSKIPFSGSTDGRGIKVVATSIGSGTTIHTATSDATLPDIITVYAFNSDTSDRTLTLGWGGTTSPDDLVGPLTIPTQSGLVLVVADLILRNSLVVKAAASSANVIALFGYVNRIS
jgi:hypothetical protein